MSRLLFLAFWGIAAASPIIVLASIALFLVGFRSPVLAMGPWVVFGTAAGLYVLAIGYFLYRVHTRDGLTDDERNRWTLTLLFAFPVAGIAYWWAHLVTSRPVERLRD